VSDDELDPQLPPSRLYTFMDAKRRHALYFLEGQRLIHDLALVHGIQGPGFGWFRDCVLQVQPLIALIKRGEQFGFYIDSDEPLVRLKVETGHSGDTRCTMYPDQLPVTPDVVRGQVRVQTLYPDGRRPYLSVIETDGLALREIVNRVLAESYQVTSALMLSSESDQSVMLHRLPPLPGHDDEDYSVEAVKTRRDELRPELDAIFARGLSAEEEILSAFSEAGWRAIASRPVRFNCSCSRERMVANLQLVKEAEGLFGPGEPNLEITCEYCKRRYEIGREEVEGGEGRPH
jgi:molecular chaperone Hsp33